MRERLNESYNFIASVENRNKEKRKEQINERAKDSQVSNG